MKAAVVFIVMCSVTLFAELSVNNPSPWVSLRSSQLDVQLVSDSSSIGKTYVFSLVANEKGKGRTISTITQKISDENVLVSFKPTKALGGQNYYSVMWQDDSSDEVSLAPIGLSPDSLFDSFTIGAESQTAPDRARLLSTVGVLVGTTRIAFYWNVSNLYIISDAKGFVGIDPGNLKGSFVSFSNRYVTIEDDSSVFFSQYLRQYSTGGVTYKHATWSGEMSASSDSITTVIIPWYELGIKPSSGRALGIILSNEESTLPAKGLKTVPATWGTLILK